MMDIFEYIDEATLKQLQRKQKSVTRLFPTFPDRVKDVADKGGIRLRDTEDTLWHFKIHSGTKKDTWYDAYLVFKNVPATLNRIINDRRLWVKDKSRIDRKKLARKFLDVVDVEVKCSCPAFQYWGPAYILSLDKYNAKYTDPEKRAPNVRNPHQYGAYCKHLQNMMRVIPFYVDTAMKWINDFYGEEVERFEQETREEYGWAQKAATGLAKKKTEVEKKPKEKEPEEERPKGPRPTGRKIPVKREGPEEEEPEEEEHMPAPLPGVPEEELEEPETEEEELEEEPEEESEEEKKKKAKESVQEVTTRDAVDQLQHRHVIPLHIKHHGKIPVLNPEAGQNLAKKEKGNFKHHRLGSPEGKSKQGSKSVKTKVRGKYRAKSRSKNKIRKRKK